MNLGISLPAPARCVSREKAGRSRPGLKAWLRQLEQLYGQVAMLDLHR